LILASEEKGESLWRLGRKMEAVAAWRDAVKQNPKLPLANNFLAGAAASLGQPETAAAYEKVADKFTPPDPFFHWVIGLRLQNAGMNELAEKHFEQAVRLNPAFRTRQNSN
jgi:tetratricopeptide (TPR) repeat protein